jgi:hypothetical protein
LERWLKLRWNSGADVQVALSDETELNDSDQPSSVLWDPKLGLIETDASFWPLLAITNGLLMRQPPETTQWLSLVRQLLDTDISTNTWIRYCSELQWIRLHGTDHELAVSTIQHLLDRHPAIKFTTQGCRFLAATSGVLPNQIVGDFLDALKTSKTFANRQSFGELLTVIALRDKKHTWARLLLEEQLLAIASGAEQMEAIATGIAFAAARLWDDPKSRAYSCRILCGLMANATSKIGHAICTVFWAAEDFSADESTDELLETIPRSEAVLSSRYLPDLVEHLANLLPHCRKRVLDVCRAIIDRRGPELTSLSYELVSSAPHFVNIAMTLQRFNDTRSGGLSLLESLLRLGLDDAYALLHDIDIRPAAACRQEPRKRRSRRKKV